MSPIEITLLVATLTLMVVGAWSMRCAAELLVARGVRDRAEILTVAFVFYAVIMFCLGFAGGRVTLL